MFVYKITNTVNGKVYIGKANCARKRWQRHVYIASRGKGTIGFSLVHAAMAKYGVKLFTFDVLCQSKTVEDSYECEQLIVAQHRSNERAFGYNLESGGRRGFKRDSELVRVASAKRVGQKRHPTVGRKISAALTGRKLPPEVVAKVAASHRGRKNSPETIAKMRASALGRVISDEQRRKISSTLTGSKHSEETKAKRVASMAGYMHSEETKAKIAASNRARALARKAKTE